MATRSTRVTGGVTTSRPRTASSRVTTGVGRADFRPLSPVVSATPAPVAAPVAAPPVLPTDPGYEARLLYITNRLNALPGTYNPQREALASTSARGLTDSGYADVATANALAPDSSGNVAYTLGLTGEGQRQRDMLTGNAGQFNARGTYYSTARNRADRLGTQQVTNARDAMLRQFQQGQTGLFNTQEQARSGLSGEQQTTMGDYTSWRAEQPVAAPTPQTPAPGEAATGAKRRVWTGAAEPVGLRNAGWQVSRRGNGTWVAIKNG